ncbi:hypothetical protein ACIQZG_02260 [Lysinibacillus sp. NPDC096418]|uniref:hypothetical protein n=1 Tax=Lysinibacillus sp. NPDC096418 TaxID=3364138 RepID=UPI00380DFF94
MAEHFSFFDPVQLPDGTYDREYNAQQFTSYFKTLVTTGILKGEMNELRVTSTGVNMQTKIDTGVAFILGRYYENDGIKELTHDTESLGVSRIDRVVIRMDLSTDKRHVLSFVKKGVPSVNPVPPQLTQTPNIYEISLAQVKVVGGQTFIAADAVTSERGKDVICPWAGSKILPSFDDNLLNKHIENKNVHLTPNQFRNDIRIDNIGNHYARRDFGGFQWKNNDTTEYVNFYYGKMSFSGIIRMTLGSLYANSNASGGCVVEHHMGFGEGVIHHAETKIITGAKGFLENFYLPTPYLYNGHLYMQLYKRKASNPVTCVVEMFGLTGTAQPVFDVLNAVTTNQVVDNIVTSVPVQQDLFTSVSNGKAQVASAITQKGVPTPPDASFAQIATNISYINTGIKSSQGVLTVPAISPLGSVIVRTPSVAFKPMNSAHGMPGSYFRNGLSQNMQGAMTGLVYMSYAEIAQDSNGWYLNYAVRNGYPSTTTVPVNLNFLITE